MSAVTRAPSPLQALRVFIVARTAASREQLRALVLEAGHGIADTPHGADVVLSDGECLPVEGAPVVTLGNAETTQAGALDGESTPEQIDAALRAVAVGLRVRSPQLAPPGLGALDEGALVTLLTPREVDVLKCIGDGLTNKRIAQRLDISLHTVKFHIESVFRKLGATSRAQALAKALERRRIDTIEF